MTVDRILADTNVLIYLIGGDGRATKALQGLNVYVSFVTEIELMSQRTLKEDDLDDIEHLLSGLWINDVNPNIKMIAAKLRREHGLKLADAIIAATALHLDIPLLTADNGFDRLDKLVKVRKL